MKEIKELRELKKVVFQKFKDKLKCLKEGETLMLFGDEKIVKTEGVEDSLEDLLESHDDEFYDLPFCDSFDNNGDAFEYKIVGLSVENGKNFVHLYNFAHEEEYLHIEKEDVSIETELSQPF